MLQPSTAQPTPGYENPVQQILLYGSSHQEGNYGGSPSQQCQQESWPGVYQILGPLIHSLRAQGHPPIFVMPIILFRLCFIEPLANMLLLLHLTPSTPRCKPLLTA